MANLNEKSKFICGRNPLAKNNRPPFAHPEQQKAALWLTEGAVNAQRSGKASYSGGVTEQGNILSLRLDSDMPELNAVVVEGGTSVLLDPEISLSGCGCSDFTCKGAAVLAESGAKVDIRNGKLITNGSTRAATIATTVYQLWRTNDEAGAMRWVLVDIVISAVVLLAVNLLEKKQKAGGRA